MRPGARTIVFRGDRLCGAAVAAWAAVSRRAFQAQGVSSLTLVIGWSGRRELHLVRDPFEVMRAMKNGIENVVAFLTEAVTPQQLEMLSSLMDERKCETLSFASVWRARRMRRKSSSASAIRRARIRSRLGVPPPRRSRAPGVRCLRPRRVRSAPLKIGAKVVSHGRYVAFQMAEVAIPRNLFADILRRIAELRPPSVTSTA